jgi:hypothetical protein
LRPALRTRLASPGFPEGVKTRPQRWAQGRYVRIFPRPNGTSQAA